MIVQARISALQCISELLRGLKLDSNVAYEQIASLGFTTSTLLQTAHREVQAGPLGSRTVRLRALEGVSELVTALDTNGCQDELAFLLPGLVSGLTKALQHQGESWKLFDAPKYDTHTIDYLPVNVGKNRICLPFLSSWIALAPITRTFGVQVMEARAGM